MVGLYLILNDYSEGRFPPRFKDQQKAYDAEIEYICSQPGISIAEMADAEMRKPFWSVPAVRRYLNNFLELVGVFEALGLQSPQKLLELGCGTGWTAELLALMQYNVLGTSISFHEIQIALLRADSLEAKQLNAELEFRTSPMETVDRVVQDRLPFDGVFVFEALHHAYDWRQALQASYRCLKPGGWLIIANEPNVLHTFIAYRGAVLSNTHELGFTRTAIVRQLKTIGFRNIRNFNQASNFYLWPHWLAAQK